MVQRYFNNLSCEEKLRWTLCVNFDVKSAVFVTLTFRDECLPESRGVLKRRVQKCLSSCRKVFKNRGENFPYIYTVEGQPNPELAQADSPWETTPWTDHHRWSALEPDNQIPLTEVRTRFHAHAFLILSGPEDMALLRSFWPWGKVHINFIRVNDPQSFPRLAAYITKEARMGLRPVGERSYVPSQGLSQYEIDGRWCDAGEDISFPPGVLKLDEKNNHKHATGYRSKLLVYRFPRDNPAAPKPYPSKGRISKGRQSTNTK